MESVNLVLKILKKWYIVLVVTTKLNNYLVAKEEFVQILFLNAPTNVKSIYHVENINAKRNAIQITAKHAITKYYRSASAVKKKERFHVIPSIIPLSKEKKEWRQKSFRMHKCTHAQRFVNKISPVKDINAKIFVVMSKRYRRSEWSSYMFVDLQ